MRAVSRWVWLVILLYLISPIDLLPDRIGPLGLIDDLFIALYLLYRFSRPKAENKGQKAEADKPKQQAEEGEKSKTPWEVLDVPEDAEFSEIQRAYRKKVAAYHPDKVSHLGAELQKLAHEKMLEIQQAFDVLRHQKGMD